MHFWAAFACGRKTRGTNLANSGKARLQTKKHQKPALRGYAGRFIMDRANVDNSLLYAIVLAAGDGRRVQLYIEEIRGEPLPKQYVNFIGRRSMLEHTFHRAEKLTPSHQIFTVVSRRHLLRADICRQLASRPRETLIVQPANKETGPGILLPLMFVYKRCPQAIVAVFPSDHFILEENRFLDHVRLAAQAAKQDPTRIVLLAIEPNEPESEYGYVVPREDVGERRFGTRRVSAFIEKPKTELAAKLVADGALWNTMVMVFKADTLLQLVRSVHPVIYRDFLRIFEAIGTREERRTIERVYEALEPTNFSKQILERIAVAHPKSISVLPVGGVFWSDLGCRERVLRVLRRLDQRQAESFKPRPHPALSGGR
jgi:mannose-1-phosphate guanylyltransferase